MVITSLNASPDSIELIVLLSVSLNFTEAFVSTLGLENPPPQPQPQPQNAFALSDEVGMHITATIKARKKLAIRWNMLFFVFLVVFVFSIKYCRVPRRSFLLLISQHIMNLWLFCSYHPVHIFALQIYCLWSIPKRSYGNPQ